MFHKINRHQQVVYDLAEDSSTAMDLQNAVCFVPAVVVDTGYYLEVSIHTVFYYKKLGF
jgi:hypothetical protein